MLRCIAVIVVMLKVRGITKILSQNVVIQGELLINASWSSLPVTHI